MKSILMAAAAALALASTSAHAADDFYKGKTVRLISGSSTGGGYDNHARFLAAYMGKHIPGNPNIVVESMPGGAGIIAPNYIYALAKKDGTEFGLFNRNTLLQGLLGVEQAKFDVEKFNWLGTTVSFSDNAHLFIIRAALPQKNIDDLRSTKFPPLHIGNDGSALVRVLHDALGVNMNLIEGYRSSDQDAAFNRGETDGHTIGYLSILNRAPQWLTESYARPMIQFGRTDRLPALPDVPTARELARNQEDLSLIQFTEAPLLVGYPFALPPDVPADRVATLRKAFQDTMEDPDYQALVQKSKLELTPKYHETIEQLLRDLAKSPEGAKKRYKDILALQGAS
jgi:tripartite-type tricarboxylate transporter receptor subunit TctC